jgi:hypothetical protein
MRFFLDPLNGLDMPKLLHDIGKFKALAQVAKLNPSFT